MTAMGYKGAIIVGILFEILLGAAAAAFYFMYYVHTPSYSINALQRAIQNGDVESFQKYVDLDAVLNKAAIDLSDIAPAGSQMRTKLQNGSFVELCKEDILYEIANKDWKEVKEPTEETDFQLLIGMKSMSMRRVEYVVKDVMIIENEDGEEVVQEGPPTASVGVRIYEPNYGDTFIIKMKMRQVDEETWQIYDVLNYGDFVKALQKQNERDLKRYVDKVRVNIRKTETKFAELKKKMPKINKEWIIAAQGIMKESCNELEELKVPLAGAKLDQLLRDRKRIFYDMMDNYYESVNFQETIEDYNKAQEEAKKKTEAKGKKPRKIKAPNFDKKASEIDGRLTQVNKKWEDNKAEIDKLIGPVVKETNPNNTNAIGLKELRNNDDEAVRRANYPGADAAAAGSGEGVNPLRAETLPEMSAFGSN